MGDEVDRMLLRHAGIDERQRNEGPPDGDERRGFSAERSSKPEQVISRVAALWASAALVGGTLVAVGVLSNPLETKAHADEIHAAIRQHDDEQDGQLKALTYRLDGMERTGQLSLQLQILGRLADIERELKGMPESSGAARTLEDTKFQLQQQLEEVKRQLRKN